MSQNADESGKGASVESSSSSVMDGRQSSATNPGGEQERVTLLADDPLAPLDAIDADRDTTEMVNGGDLMEGAVDYLGSFRPNGTVALISDFGQRDPFVAVMKAVMLKQNLDLRFLDLTHEIPAQNIDAASFWLACTAEYAPRGTVFLCVVDPGVGGHRGAVAVWGDDYAFVAPDNGLLAGVKHHVRFQAEIALDPGDRNRTFHGRDVFAPVAARLASGTSREQDFGPAHALPKPTLPSIGGEWDLRRGHVVVVDHFGNLMTDISVPSACELVETWVVPTTDPKAASKSEGLGLGSPVLTGVQAASSDVSLTDAFQKSGISLPCVKAYADAEANAPLALVNSWRRVEIAVRDGRADELYGGVGVDVLVRFAK